MMIEQSSFNRLVGATLGNYRLEKLLDRDALGPVFLARSTAHTQFLLRILCLPADMTPEARIVYLGRFQQEANQVATLQHPNVLPLVDYGNHEGMPYCVWPYNAEAKPLHTHIAQYGPLDTLITGRYMDQIAAALEHAHQHAVLHRNLTSHAIYMETATSPYNARIVVAEFGLLRMLELAYQNELKTMPAINMGSEGCAPEQLLGNPVTSATDIYALGAVLYRLLTGQRAFVAQTVDELNKKILQASAPSVSAGRSHLPPGLDSVIARAMAKDPAKRFSQPRELTDAYHQCAGSQDTARPAPAVFSMPAPVKLYTARTASLSRRRVLFYIVAGGAAAAAAVTTVAIVGPRLLSGGSSSTSQAGTANTPVTATRAPGSSPTAATPSHTGRVIARASDVPPNSAKTFSIQNQSNPGLLIHLANSSTFVAFNSTCTHAGCAVNYNPQDKLLECPCHGSVFDPAKQAAVIQGPAPTPLAQVAITVNADGTITTA